MNYTVTKLLCNLLEPHIPADNCALDTLTFVREIS